MVAELPIQIHYAYNSYAVNPPINIESCILQNIRRKFIFLLFAIDNWLYYLFI